MRRELRIRTARASDWEPLAELYRQLHPEDPALAPQDAAGILEQLGRYPGSAILLGLVDGVPVTTCTLVVIPNLTRGGAPYALIENVVSDSGQRRRGYGRAVLEAAIDAAWRAGCYKVMLLTGSKDPDTLCFYRAAGFEQSKTGFQIRRRGP